MLTSFILLAEDLDGMKSGWGGMIFMGIFIIAAMAAGIWWLQR
jgi:hypothetical protein